MVICYSNFNIEESKKKKHSKDRKDKVNDRERKSVYLIFK